MLKLLTDENFNGDILRGLFRRRPDLDVARVQDLDLAGRSDQEILARAAVDGRILLSHDRDTMPRYAFERVNAGEPMAGVFLVETQTGRRRRPRQIAPSREAT